MTLITVANMSDVGAGSALVTTSPFVMTTWQPYFLVNVAGAVTFTINQAVLLAGQPLTIVDQGYVGRSQNRISVFSNAGALFNGQGSIQIATTYGWVICVFDGTNFECKVLP